MLGCCFDPTANVTGLGQNWIRGNGNNLQLNCAASGFFAIETNGTERFRIASTGAFGLGGATYGSPGISANGDGYIGKHDEPQHPCIGERMRHFFNSANPSYPFRGQMSQVYFIDGQQLQPSDFAETVDFFLLLDIPSFFLLLIFANNDIIFSLLCF